jgi:hypothetical protein
VHRHVQCAGLEKLVTKPICGHRENINYDWSYNDVLVPVKEIYGKDSLDGSYRFK